MGNMENLHAKLAPSSMGVTVHCAGSVPMQEFFPEDLTSMASMEGTASHWVASSCLESYLVPGGNLALCNDFVGKMAPNGIIITKEMAEGANEYVREVLLFVQERGALRTMQVEQRVNIGRVHALNWGTPDAVVYVPSNNLIKVFDYKYGHRYVDVFENWQLMDYGIGVVDKLTGGNGIQDQNLEIEFCIVQPRSYGRGSTVREWKIKAHELRAYCNVMEQACIAALAPNPITKTGAHCVYCTARHACTAAQEAGFNAVEVSLQMSPNVLDNNAMGLELKTLYHAEDALKARITGLEEKALMGIKQGEIIPGFSTKETYGRQNWIKPIKEVQQLGDLLNVDLTKPAEVITPKQAIKQGIPKEVVASYSQTPKSGVKLIPDDSNEIKRMFSK